MTAGSSSPIVTPGRGTGSPLSNPVTTDMSSTTTFGSQTSTPKSDSPPDHPALSPTAIAPSDTVAQNVTTHSIELRPRMATRSPAPTPCDASHYATRPTAAW